MIQSSDDICMFDVTTGRELWKESLELSDAEATRKILLTDTLCIYFYTEGDDSKVFQRGYLISGKIMLRVFEARTGKELYHGECWPFDWSFRNADCPFSFGDWEPMVVAASNVVCVASMVRSKDCDKNIHYSTYRFSGEPEIGLSTGIDKT